MRFGLLVAVAAMLVWVVPAAAQAQSSARPAQAQSGVARQVIVEGTQRIEPATVTSYMTIREGQAYDDAAIDASLKALFATGLFADVSIRRQGEDLVVSIVENPIVNRVAFEGNSSIDDEDLEKETQLKPRIIFTRTKVQADVQRILELLRRKGRFAAVVEPKIIQLPQNRVDLVYEITEGEVTGVSRINFVGNKVFSDSELREQIATRETRWWRILSSNDNYDPDRVAFDREQLRRFYLSNGYADFEVVSAVADLARDRSSFFITFTLEEGDQYRFGGAEFETTLNELDPVRLASLLKYKEGEVYNAQLVDDSIDALTFEAGSRGYAFADVRPRLRRNAETKTIDIVYVIEEGPRVYIERIDIVGNTRTLDKVIRREFRVAEGDAFNRVLINRSRQRVRALDFFEEVEITEEPGSAPDRTVLNVSVKEKSTGELSLGAGFSSAENFVADVSISERNLLGRGQFLRFRVTASERRQQVDIRFTEPYFLDRNVAAGFDLYQVVSDYPEASYETETTGGGIRIGFPVSEFGRFGMSYTYRSDNISASLSAPLLVLLQQGTFDTSVIGLSYVYDDRDDPLKPTDGWLLSGEYEFAGIGGDLQYIRIEGSVDNYMPVLWKGWVLNTGLDVGYITGWGGQDVRLNERFFRGGSTFRGFDVAGVGPRDTEVSGDNAVGGNFYAIGSAELLFPNPLPAEFGVETSFFADVGTVGIVDDKAPWNCGAPPLGFARTCVQDDLTLRASIGLGVSWQSPFGPIRLDFAYPFLKEDFDETQTFRFSAGTRF